MENFRKKSIQKRDIPESDLGIKVSELVSLIDTNPLSVELLSLLKVDTIRDEFIGIPGAKMLVDAQRFINRKYQKEDLKSLLNDISLYNKEDFTINFNNVKDHEYFAGLKMNSISTTPIYSAKRDFFGELFSMDRYASRLIEEGHKSILESNFHMLKEVLKPQRKYRILHDKDEDLFYLRAIISVNSYHNYDNSIAIVVGLLTLHNEMKKTGVSYKLQLCEYNESHINIFFESSEVKQLSTIGTVKNIIEVSNDEIKQEALKFSGICSIVFGDNDGEEQELFISSQEVKSKIISIKHNQIPKTAIEQLSNIDNTADIHSKLYQDISEIVKIQKPDQIRFLLRRKVENAKNDGIKKYKSNILSELNTSVSSIVQLLTLFKKVELLANEDIEATEYLRYVFYQVISENRKK